jgi:hypothetical protein
MSKFYEVLDTMIILASGKKSSTLQTYHHAGIMFCTWASLKYASPGYMVGIVLNSGVHTLMVSYFRTVRGYMEKSLTKLYLQYSYFAIQSLGFSIPMSIKRSLTSIQIAQFLVGLVWGNGYVFSRYDFGLDGLTEQAIANLTGAFENGNTEFPVDTTVSCLSDSGEALTVMMSTIYILPLIFMFVQFFIRSYVKAKVTK